MATTAPKPALKSDIMEPATDKSVGTTTTKKLQWDPQVVDKETKNTASTIESLVNQEAKANKQQKICSFCGRHPAAIMVKSPHRKKRALCLLHYYTTSAVHEGSEFVTVLNDALVQSQLHGTCTSITNSDDNNNDNDNNNNNNNNKLNVQDLFAEAFVQLQQELAQESLSFVSLEPQRKVNPRKAPPEQDPLSILQDLGRTKKRPRKPPLPATPQGVDQEGGFLRHVPLPERLRKTQQQQAKIQADLVARMNRVAKTGKTDTSARRQPARKMIWNALMDETTPKQPQPVKKRVQVPTFQEVDLTVDGVTCTCGSHSVSSVGNVTSRNQDVRKGEIWGSGDRSNDDVVLKYRCNQCGKTWQEAG